MTSKLVLTLALMAAIVWPLGCETEKEESDSEIKYWNRREQKARQEMALLDEYIKQWTPLPESAYESPRTKTFAEEYPLSIQIKGYTGLKLRLGMGESTVRNRIGSPGHINRSIGSWGVHEQWVYDRTTPYPHLVCLYFENGVLTSIQD